MSNKGLNIQIAAGQISEITRRTVKTKSLTTLRITGYPFAILVWEQEVLAQKGDFVFARGRVQTRSYEQKGKKVYVTEVIAYQVTNLSDGQAGNVVLAVGNLGGDPELRTTGSGKAVTSVSMAANTSGAERPEWFNLTAWEKVAEVISRYLHKGSRLAVVGRLITKNWQYQGKPFQRTELVVGKMLMLGGRKEEDTVPPVDDPELADT